LGARLFGQRETEPYFMESRFVMISGGRCAHVINFDHHSAISRMPEAILEVRRPVGTQAPPWRRRGNHSPRLMRTGGVRMTSSISYFAMAQYLQSATTRYIEFRDGGFFCENEEVTGKKYISDLDKLNFGSVTHEENRIVSVREGRSLRDCFPNDRKSSNENNAPFGSISDAGGGSGAEQVIILGLEDYETGALVSLVADSPEGRAAIGRLCNLYGRHSASDVIVKLTTCNRRGAKGYLIRAPELSVVGWERCCRSSDMDDDIPF
jgi:hypothetical protein